MMHSLFYIVYCGCICHTLYMYVHLYTQIDLELTNQGSLVTKEDVKAEHAEHTCTVALDTTSELARSLFISSSFIHKLHTM